MDIQRSPSKYVNLLNSPFVVKCSQLLLLLLIIAVIFFCFVLDFIPPLEKDALIHHLAIPKIWINAGGFVETPWAPFSYYPMNLDILYLFPLLADIDFVAKFIHHMFGLLTAFLIYLYLRSRVGRGWSLLGSLIFLSTPLIMRLSASAYVDLGLTFFITAAIISIIHWVDTNNTTYFLLAAVSIGLGLGTKYQGLISLPLLCPSIIIIRSKQGDSNVRALLWGFSFFLISCLIFSPWLIKNYYLTGNPTYPLYNSLWGLPSLVPPEMSISPFVKRQFLYGESFWEYATIPLRVFFQGKDFSRQFFGSVLNPLLLLLPPFALISREPKELRPIALFSLLWLLIVFLKTALVARYLAPIIPLLSILCVFGIRNIFYYLRKHFSNSFPYMILPVTIAFLIYLNASWAYGFWCYLDAKSYLTGNETRRSYLYRKLPDYPAMDFINRRLPKNAKILFLFTGNRSYYCDRDFFHPRFFEDEILRPLITKSTTTQEVLKMLKNTGASHLLIREDLLLHYLQNNYRPAQLKIWNRFFSSKLKPLFKFNGFTVYRIY